MTGRQFVTPITLAARRGERKRRHREAFDNHYDEALWDRFIEHRGRIRQTFCDEGLTSAAANLLLVEGFETLDEVASADDETLLNIRNLGQKRLAEIRRHIPRIDPPPIVAAGDEERRPYPESFLEYAQLIHRSAEHTVTDNGDGSFTHTYSWTFAPPFAAYSIEEADEHAG